MRISPNDLGHQWNKLERNADIESKLSTRHRVKRVGLTNQLKIVLS